MLQQIDFDGSNYIGVYARVSEKYGIFSRNVPDFCLKEAEKNLGIEVLKTTIAHTSVVGCMIAMNSNGMIVNRFIGEDEERKLKSLDLNMGYTRSALNAVGNIILVNDKAALVHPKVSKSMVEVIRDVLGVEVFKENIGNFVNLGMACALTNKGIVCHPDTKRAEIKKLEENFGVKGGWSTVNHGASFVGSGILCNSKGALIGERTTTVEITRIQDTLDL
jgi:translation initiation factor eIF-6, putative